MRVANDGTAKWPGALIYHFSTHSGHPVAISAPLVLHGALHRAPDGLGQYEAQRGAVPFGRLLGMPPQRNRREPGAKLTEVARARGWQIAATFTDAGISGAKGRNDRPGLDDMLKQAQRGKFDVVMAWAIDRVGR